MSTPPAVAPPAVARTAPAAVPAAAPPAVHAAPEIVTPGAPTEGAKSGASPYIYIGLVLLAAGLIVVNVRNRRASDARAAAQAADVPVENVDQEQEDRA